MSIDAKRQAAAAAFVGLLILSVLWPAPAVTVNGICCHAALPIDDLSFLGREAPSWDVVFWCLAGLVTIAILQSGEWSRDDWREPWDVLRGVRMRVPLVRVLAAFAIAGVVVALVWRFADERITAFAESLQTTRVEDLIRYANRFGGGMNPPMVILFFVIAGVAYRHRRWVEYGVAMALAGLGAGLLVQIVKFTVGRTRPELWLGAFHHARASASSFPSGHTVGAFALAGVLVIASRSLPLRVAAFLLAVAVAGSRVLAFRHWTSDVLASALLGVFAAWVVVTGLTSDRGVRS